MLIHLSQQPVLEDGSGFTQTKRLTNVFEHNSCPFFLRRGWSKTGKSFHVPSNCARVCYVERCVPCARRGTATPCPKSAPERSGFLGGYFQSFIGFSLFDIFVYLQNKVDNKERDFLFEGLKNTIGECTLAVGKVHEDSEQNTPLLEDIDITFKSINTFLVEISKKTDSSS